MSELPAVTAESTDDEQGAAKAWLRIRWPDDNVRAHAVLGDGRRPP